MARMTTNPEQDQRLALLNTLLTTPHRKLEQIHPVHAEMVKQDPRFYVRLGAWYNDRGDVRDHKEMFAVTLILSEFPGHRDVGLAMLRELPPYQVVRVLDFIHGRKTTRKVRERASAERPARARGERPRRGAIRRALDAVTGRADAHAAAPAPAASSAPARTVTESFGLFKNPPR